IGTGQAPRDGAASLRERTTVNAPGFLSQSHPDSERLALLPTNARDRLAQGGDVSHGFYLERPSYLSLALVCCFPNRARPELHCPVR
ncbi:hypothetical protein, partial [Streptomyces sp. NPDC058953]|uniref:hypothetical protein n=1 Tax=Streptomyces sp. NPDC058953 TaxID=3346676 RepID=UPI0036D17247